MSAITPISAPCLPGFVSDSPMSRFPDLALLLPLPEYPTAFQSIPDWRGFPGDRVAPPPSAVSFFNDLTALCLHPPAMDPPGGSCFVANNRENEFDRTVTERSKSFLCVFQRANARSISAPISLSNCPVGRRSQHMEAARRKDRHPERAVQTGSEGSRLAQPISLG
jgi:hypothetical protein